ncbi:TolC family outer membrane protein [Piscirickettsia salmonis]|uniref:TolC family outer membrane protein n=2 Tax=Piscirickettsia salmonis TaxID=1238 RepID=UPI00211D93E7|nr:TolC family outer membrane protein [Piscirickettsia salmonis]
MMIKKENNSMCKTICTGALLISALIAMNAFAADAAVTTKTDTQASNLDKKSDKKPAQHSAPDKDKSKAQQPQSLAVDLITAYQQALQKDPTLKAAAATYQAQQQLTPIARAGLLPQIVGTANTQGNRQSPSAPERYNSHGFSLTLTQSIFSYSNWKTLAQSYPQVAGAAADYESAKQSLILRVAQTYLDILQAEDELKAAQANEDALAETLKQSQQRFNVGLVAITDVQTTRASYESAIATRVQAENTVANNQEALAEITGVIQKNIIPMRYDIPLTKPMPNNIDNWVAAALKGNPALASARYDQDAGNDAVGIAAGAFIPTLDGTATYTRAASNASAAGAQSNLAQSGQLSATWNLFQGGTDYATYKQASYTAKATASNYVNTERSTTTKTRQDFLSVIAGIGTVNAYKQAVISSESSLKSFQAGYAVGTETIVNVLDAQKKLFDSRSSYAQQKYQYIIDTLNLKADTGSLAIDDLKKINSWLQVKKS